MIPLVKPAIYPEQELFLAELVRHPEYHTTGHFTTLCEKWLENRFLGSKALVVTSCTHALEAAFMALGLPRGAEVIMASWNFVSAGNAAVRAGLTPVWAEIDDNGNICPESVKGLISTNTRAVLIMHYLGIPAQMSRLMEVAKAHDLFVIEDAAYGLFSEFEGTPLGGFGHMGCISFDHTKPLHSGRGGAIIVNDRRFEKHIEQIVEMGTDKAAFLRGECDFYQWQCLGSKYRMPEASAALLWAGFSHYDAIRSGFESIFEKYGEVSDLGIKGRAGAFLNLPKGIHREEVIRQFKEAGIYSAFHYRPLHLSYCGGQFRKGSEWLDNTRWFGDTLLRIPINDGLSPKEQSHIIHVLKQAVKVP